MFFRASGGPCHFFVKSCIFPLAEQREPDYKGATPQAHAPFVYRLGRQIFILKRGVRLP
ncbi:conserved hypothetical protein [Agrobacterium deltaense Zutra 3/1]|uniref:Uncharacterized protein n=1 Tax=Agrobacterium deltaense Zutra 3/1 TaxID=1183427 RepID=A0A1S7PD37_9HYPH|nr:conserved hypothetical protein [Agrobacterium deltaense Zutra 3/1]